MYWLSTMNIEEHYCNGAGEPFSLLNIFYKVWAAHFRSPFRSFFFSSFIYLDVFRENRCAVCEAGEYCGWAVKHSNQCFKLVLFLTGLFHFRIKAVTCCLTVKYGFAMIHSWKKVRLMYGFKRHHWTFIVQTNYYYKVFFLSSLRM